MTTRIGSRQAPKTTALGTPCSASWTSEWVQKVDGMESALGRRICGAFTPGGAPCQLDAQHVSGRCRFHGGDVRNTPPDGNGRAVQHGLYAQGIRKCSQRCPHFAVCPMAGRDVADVDETSRPSCVYELDDYTRTLGGILASLGLPADDLAESAVRPRARNAAAGADAAAASGGAVEVPGAWNRAAFADTMARASAESFAMARVLARRALGQLQYEELVTAANVQTAKGMQTALRASQLTEAYLRLDREQRRWQQQLEGDAERVFAARREVGSAAAFEAPAVDAAAAEVAAAEASAGRIDTIEVAVAEVCGPEVVKEKPSVAPKAAPNLARAAKRGESGTGVLERLSVGKPRHRPKDGSVDGSGNALPLLARLKDPGSVANARGRRGSIAADEGTSDEGKAPLNIIDAHARHAGR